MPVPTWLQAGGLLADLIARFGDKQNIEAAGVRSYERTESEADRSRDISGRFTGPQFIDDTGLGDYFGGLKFGGQYLYSPEGYAHGSPLSVGNRVGTSTSGLPIYDSATSNDFDILDFYLGGGAGGLEQFNRIVDGLGDISVPEIAMEDLTYDPTGIRAIAGDIGAMLRSGGTSGDDLVGSMDFNDPDFAAREAAGLNRIATTGQATADTARQNAVAAGLAGGQSLESLNPTLQSLEYSGNVSRASQAFDNAASIEGQKDEYGRFQDTIESDLRSLAEQLATQRDIEAAGLEFSGAATGDELSVRNMADLLAARGDQARLDAEVAGENRAFQLDKADKAAALSQSDYASELAAKSDAQAMMQEFMNAIFNANKFSAGRSDAWDMLASSLFTGNSETYYPWSDVLGTATNFALTPEPPEPQDQGISTSLGFNLNPLSWFGT